MAKASEKERKFTGCAKFCGYCTTYHKLTINFQPKFIIKYFICSSSSCWCCCWCVPQKHKVMFKVYSFFQLALEVCWQSEAQKLFEFL